MKKRNGGLKVLMWCVAQVMLIISISILIMEEASDVSIMFLIIVVFLLILLFIGYNLWGKNIRS